MIALVNRFGWLTVLLAGALAVMAFAEQGIVEAEPERHLIEVPGADFGLLNRHQGPLLRNGPRVSKVSLFATVIWALFCFM